MNDDFMLTLREPVDSIFEIELARFLNELPETEVALRRSRRTRAGQFVLIGALGALVVACSLWGIPKVVRILGGVAVTESTEAPLPPNNDWSAARRASPQATATTLASIQEIPFKAYLPTWLPEGYALLAIALADRTEGRYWLQLVYDKAPGTPILLEVLHDPRGRGVIFGVQAGATEEINVGGRSALLQRGVWSSSSDQQGNQIEAPHFDAGNGKVFYWRNGDNNYRMSVSSEFPDADLIRIWSSSPAYSGK